ncbi:MAG: hypothetical protein RL477_678 [Pseudomonadota bacterium]|jgi:tripartite-type tricarboxylate transporter receptor subunit TctC
MKAFHGALCVAAALAAGATGSVSHAADYYAGKQVSIYVGSSPGGGYDGYARLLSRHWGRLIAGNPNFLIKNMPGASSLKAMNYVSNVAPKDGTAIAAVQNGVALEPLLQTMGAKNRAEFDPAKINWIGAVTREVALVVTWHTSPFKTFADVQKSEMIGGAAGANTDDAVFSRLMNATIGTKIKVVQGYKGSSEMMIALEKGEIQAMPGWNYSSLSSQRPQWLSGKLVRILAQNAMQKHPALQDVPLAVDFARDAESRQVMELISSRLDLGRPYLAPPAIPEERLKDLRGSFVAMMKDQKFNADATKAHFEINPLSPEQCAAVVKAAYAMPKSVVDKAREILIARK